MCKPTFRHAIAAFEARAQNLGPDDRGLGAPCFPEGGIRLLAEECLLNARCRTPWAGLPGAAEGLRLGNILDALRAVGRTSLAVGRLYEGHLNALQLIGRFGTKAQQQQAAEDLDAGHLFAIWNRDGTDPTLLNSEGRGSYRLRGAKAFASGAGHVTRPLVTATLSDGARQLVLLDDRIAEAPVDRSTWKPLGMEASCSFEVDLDGIVVEDSHLIGSAGDYLVQPWLGGGAIRYAAVQIGGAEAVFDLTRRHLRDLGRAGDPQQRTRSAQMAIATESGSLWLDRGALVLDAIGEDPAPEASARALAYASMVRTAIERIALDVIEAATRSVGVVGLIRPHPFEQVVRDLTMYLRQPAPDAAESLVGTYVLERDEAAQSLWRPSGG